MTNTSAHEATRLFPLALEVFAFLRQGIDIVWSGSLLLLSVTLTCLGLCVVLQELKCDCRCDASGRVDKAQTDLRRCGVNMMM